VQPCLWMAWTIPLSKNLLLSQLCTSLISL
jgi:hypothetical protein